MSPRQCVVHIPRVKEPGVSFTNRIRNVVYTIEDFMIRLAVAGISVLAGVEIALTRLEFEYILYVRVSRYKEAIGLGKYA